MIKVSVLLKRKPGMSAEELHRYWKDVRGPHLLSVPELARYIRKYVRCHAIRETLSGTPRETSPYDGIAEMWGDSLNDVRRALAEPRYLEVIRPDEIRFLALPNCVFIVTEEVAISQ